MQIKPTNLTYNFNSEGTTTSVLMTLGGSDGANFVNANIEITADDLADKSFDTLTKAEAQTIARGKLAKFVTAKE